MIRMSFRKIAQGYNCILLRGVLSLRKGIAEETGNAGLDEERDRHLVNEDFEMAQTKDNANCKARLVDTQEDEGFQRCV